MNIPYTLIGSIEASVPLPLQATLANDLTTISCRDTSSILGRLEEHSTKIIRALRNEPSISLQFFFAQPPEGDDRKPTSRAKSKKSTFPLALFVNVYGSSSVGEAFGHFASQCGFYIQQPLYADRDVEYCNPHCLSRDGLEPLFTHSLNTCVSSTLENISIYLERNPIDAFALRADNDIIPEAQDPKSLRTPLKRHQRQALTFMVLREQGSSDTPSLTDLWLPTTDKLGRKV